MNVAVRGLNGGISRKCLSPKNGPESVVERASVAVLQFTGAIILSEHARNSDAFITTSANSTKSRIARTKGDRLAATAFRLYANHRDAILNKVT